MRKITQKNGFSGSHWLNISSVRKKMPWTFPEQSPGVVVSWLVPLALIIDRMPTFILGALHYIWMISTATIWGFVGGSGFLPQKKKKIWAVFLGSPEITLLNDFPPGRILNAIVSFYIGLKLDFSIDILDFLIQDGCPFGVSLFVTLLKS